MKKNTVKTHRWLAGSIALASHGLRVEALPKVPDGRQAVSVRAAGATRYMSAAQRDLRVEALREIEGRAKAHGRELGDLAPDPTLCGEVADDLAAIDAVIARLDELRSFAVEWRTAAEDAVVPMLKSAAEEAAPRVERGLVDAESYAKLLRYGGLQGEAIVEGRARAKRARSAMAAKTKDDEAPANDTTSPAKTGTDPR